MGNGYPNSTIAQILEDIISQLSFEGESHSNIADILLSILNQTSYDKEPYSVLAELFLKLKAKIEGVPFDPYDKETHSVIADILVSILNETEYTDVPQSRIAELLLELKEELESYTEITVSGSIVSFTTNVSKPLVKLKADVEAQQDLHGYDKPWAGGGGANKWDEQWEQGTINATTGEPEPASSSMRSKNFIRVQPSTVYFCVCSYISGMSGASIPLYCYDSNKDYIGRPTPTSVNNATFTTPSNCYYIKFRTGAEYGNTYRNDIAINYPSTVTTYSPYSNICPITGWSGANVTRTGKNLLTMDYLESGSISGSGAFINSPLRLRTSGSVDTMTPVKPSQVYTYSLQGAEGVTNLHFMEANEYSKDRVWLRNRALNRATGQYTPSADCYYVIFLIRKSDNSAIDVSDVDYLQVEVGSSTATSYEPYNGNTYTIAFGDTYYGCELDVTNGVLRVTHELVDMGTANWVGSYYQFTIPTPSTAKGFNGDNLCSIYPRSAVNNTTPSVQTDKSYIVRSDTIYVKDTDYNGNLAGFKTAMAGQKLVYELATPFTIQLSPQQIDALAGDNVIFADTGDVEVTYLYKGTQET